MTPIDFKRIRSQTGMTQSRLAQVLQVSSARTIRHWEMGDRSISGPVALLMELIDRNGPEWVTW